MKKSEESSRREPKKGMDTDLLKESFEALKPVANPVVDRFVASLFQNHPEAKALFREEGMGRQKTALIKSFVTIIEKIDRPEELNSYLTSLGELHAGLGVENPHYDWGAEEFLATLRYFFDDTWTPALEDAWMVTVGWLVETMRTANRRARDARRGTSNPVPTEKRMAEIDVKQEIEEAVKALLRDAVNGTATTPEFRELAATHARALIKEALREQLEALRAQLKGPNGSGAGKEAA